MLVLSRKEDERVVIGVDRRLGAIDQLLGLAGGDCPEEVRAGHLREARRLVSQMHTHPIQIVTRPKGRRVRLMIDAPAEVPVNRAELL